MLLFHRAMSVRDGKARSRAILVFFGLDPAPPSFRHARPPVRRLSGLDSSVLGPVSNSVVPNLFRKALGRRKGGTFSLAACENKRAEIDGVLVGKGNIFLSGSTSAALGKCNATLFWLNPIIVKGGTHTYNMIKDEQLPKKCHEEQYRCSNSLKPYRPMVKK